MATSYPAEYLYSDDEEYYVNESPEKLKKTSSENIAKIKFIKPLGSAAGIGKVDFDITLDINSQQWFDQIYQYWKNCKLVVLKITKFYHIIFHR